MLLRPCWSAEYADDGDDDDGQGLWSVQRMSALLPTTIIFRVLKDTEIYNYSE